MENQLLNDLAARGCEVAEMLDDTYMGREDFYVKILKRLPESDVVERLHASIVAGNVRATFEAAHELKGLYATLGLTPAYKICCELVEKVRPQVSLDGVAELYAQLEPMHRELVALIAAA